MNDAGGPEYLELATKNASHFAPAAGDTSFTSGAENNKTAWFLNHKRALDLAAKGHLDEALQVNAFGDHFLTDAFAAGHSVNKQLIMDKAEAMVNKDPRTFEVAVATAVLGDPKGDALNFYEANPGVFKAWAPMSVQSLADVIDRLRFWKSKSHNAFLNNFVKVVHDHLNNAITTAAGGPQVSVGGGPAFAESGDSTLSRSGQTLAAGQIAVARSRQDVLDVHPDTRGGSPAFHPGPARPDPVGHIRENMALVLFRTAAGKPRITRSRTS